MFWSACLNVSVLGESASKKRFQEPSTRYIDFIKFETIWNISVMWILCWAVANNSKSNWGFILCRKGSLYSPTPASVRDLIESIDEYIFIRSILSMVSVTMTSPQLGTVKKRKRDETTGKENTLRIKPVTILTDYLQDQRLSSSYAFIRILTRIDMKSRLASSITSEVNSKRRKSKAVTPVLTAASVPNSPLVPASPVSETPKSAGYQSSSRCHICFRSQGITLKIYECPLCEKGMCQICTRTCTLCEEERCSKCCVEE